MSSITITVPREYGYVILVASATFLTGVWHGMRVGGFRKAAKVPYPIPYALSGTSDAAAASSESLATEKYLFNCAQRGHGNFLENYPIFMPALLIAGLKYPVASSYLGVAWIVSRFIYALGYTRKDKTNGSGRLWGSGYLLCQIALVVMAGLFGWDLLS